MKCPKCDTVNPDDSRFCKDCGTNIISAEEAQPSITKTIETHREELTRGTVFAGRYEIIEELGKGGMGKVYRVFDNKIEAEVALKLVRPDIAADKKTVERFKNEMKLARDITHKNVCRMYDLNEEHGTHFITMEYVSGGDLKRFIRRSGQLSIGATLKIAKQLCEGLSEAHRLGVVHRDLKPNNIMIDDDGNARIMDFGIARSLSTKGITGAGVMIGTPEYMSPEQVEGKEVDQRSDIYSLGIILYEMVAGRVPFEGDTPFSIGVKQKSEIPRPPKEINEQIPEDLNRMILLCMEKDKERRYQSVWELHSGLTNLEQGIPTTERVPPKRKPLTSKEITVTFRKPWIMIAALVVAVIVVAFLLFYFIEEKPEPSLPPSEKKMIAVLPFENLGAPEDEYFADGITYEIMVRLASIPHVGVIAQTSTLQYKNTNKSFQDIAGELGVDYILKGSIRWQKLSDGPSRIRVTPQLIDVSGSTQLWASNYDKEINDIFQVQSEIAEKVIHQLDITLSESEQQALMSRPTDNILSYQAYLKGMDYRQRPEYSVENLRMRVQMFERAVKIDSDFALAYAELSRSHSFMYHERYDRTEKRLAMAKAAVDQASDLNPDLTEVPLALGYYFYHGKNDYIRALEQFAIALESQPESSDILSSIGYVQRRQGSFELALHNLKKAFLMSPRDALLALNTAVTCLFVRKYAEAEHYLDLTISLAPDESMAYAYKALNYWLLKGDTDKAREILEGIPDKSAPRTIFALYKQNLYERDYPAALEQLSLTFFESFISEWWFIPKAQLAGQVYRLRDEPELTRASYESALKSLEEALSEHESDARLHSALINRSKPS
jgi:serine/threonine protein kinase